MDIEIRSAVDADAADISGTIIDTLRASNTQDYSSAIIEQVIENFSPLAVRHLMTVRQVLVASLDRQIVATASLDQDVVRSVFVDSSHQGQGIGRRLMDSIELLAMDADLKLLRVPSSITAEGFYAALGFEKIRDEFHQSERTIIMAKTLKR